MALIVQKFGGTSINGSLRIKACIEIIQRELFAGNKVVVVVSAMSGVTDSLLSDASEFGRSPLSEVDALISCGEQMTASIMSMALSSVGVKARSWLGWQIPIITNDVFFDAEILNIDPEKILYDLDCGVTPVISGFQGVFSGRITTIGRGGSDTTAAAIAAAIKADRCDIYTDVDYVYTGDPRRVPNVKKLHSISYDEMFEMSFWGAKVVHSRAVDIARTSGIQMQVLSSFNSSNGTLIHGDRYSLFSGITCLPESMSIFNVSGINTASKKVLSNINGVIYSSYDECKDVFSILIKSCDKQTIESLLDENSLVYSVVEDLKAVSVIGTCSQESGAINPKLLECISNHDIKIYMSFSNKLRATIVLENSKIEKSMLLMHEEFSS